MLSKNLQRIKNLCKRFLFDTVKHSNGYDINFEIDAPDKNSIDMAQTIRGKNREPGIMVHGGLPRSGINFAVALLKDHPKLSAYPNELWEIPFLSASNKLIEFQERFFRPYPQNKQKINSNDFLPLFGASFTAYLHSFIPEDERFLVKLPSVEYLPYFFCLFPEENLIIIYRDGRDVVESSMRTWPEKNFNNLCNLWHQSTQLILKFQEVYGNQSQRHMIFRFEDVVKAPDIFVESVCTTFGLDTQLYPFNNINNVGVIGSSSIKKNGSVTWNEIEKPKNFNPIGRWSNWSAKQKTIFKNIAGETLMEASYSKDLNW